MTEHEKRLQSLHGMLCGMALGWWVGDMLRLLGVIK